MPSSISSSKLRRPQTGAVWIAVSLLLLFVTIEFGARKYARRRQNLLTNPKDYTSIGARAEVLMRQKGTKIVFVGNSATQEGIDLPLFERAFARQKSGGGLSIPVSATMCTATGSSLTDWNWMLEKHFWRPKRHADLFVVTFFGDNLQDRSAEDPGRLAQFFTTPRDWPVLFENDVKTLGERSDFVFSYASMFYTMRPVTQSTLLKLFAPNYESYWTELNVVTQKQLDAQQLSPSANARSLLTPPPSYSALQRVLRRAQETQSKLCFIAFPLRDAKSSYALSPRAIEMIKNAGMTFLDFRQMPELSQADYRDAVHTNAKGRPIWTQRMAKVLATEINSYQPLPEKRE